jgi:nucleotide-binding universal stress UspA family protein
MRTILIPTDFSAPSRNAAIYAINLFGSGARYILLNGYTMPSHRSAAMMINLDEELESQSVSNLKKEKKKILDHFGNDNIQMDMRAEPGNFLACVERVCKSDDVNCVVMGSKGSTGLESVFIGSNSYSVAREATCPVIIVPEHAQNTGLKKVVYTADYNFKGIDFEKGDKYIIDLVSSQKAAFNVFHIFKPDDADQDDVAAKERLAARFGTLNPNFHSEIRDNIADGIDNFVDHTEADMVIMRARESGFFDSVFKTSITRKIALHTRVPVLVINEHFRLDSKASEPLNN